MQLDTRIKTYLVGAGPGDPELLTLKAARLLRDADVILHDSLVSSEILALARPDAKLVDVGKRCGKHAASQAEICRLLVGHARQGGLVLRLKGGDPMVFGRATEEILALREAGIGFEIIPGVTAATAAAARLQLSLTQRQRARSLHFLTGHGAENGLPAHDWAALTKSGGTLAVYMGGKTLAALAARLLAAGMTPDMPALAIENISLGDERVIAAALAELPAAVAAAGLSGPVLLLIGEACAELHGRTMEAAPPELSYFSL